MVTLRDSDHLPALLQREGIDVTMFTDWFELNKRDPAARTLTYAEIPKRYVWHEKLKLWKPRKQQKCIGRIVYSSPASGERYYLRMLLNVVRGPKEFTELMIVNKRPYTTFKETCFAYGLLNDDKEWTHAISEASFWALGPQLRDLFVAILIFCDTQVLKVVYISGITSLLFPDGRTAQSRFVIPLELMENNTCRIKQNTHLAELMQQVQLIIWDEASMTQKYAFEALDKTLRNILGRWYRAGEKKQGEDEATWIEIPERFLIKHVVQEMYLDFTTRQHDDDYLKERAILTPRNDDADAINAYMFKKLAGDTVTYNSADEICKASIDTLEQHKPSRVFEQLKLPRHATAFSMLKERTPHHAHTQR
ncbi:ATP-dependent DNA helicase PIF1-like protein [Tanacetum coccineum]|uniref:ATP-dependent DNA helicase n=1 Tax=Tanacetum coccineum TaxID=301880 RepID=A0ABQ5EUN5_9ASTR